MTVARKQHKYRPFLSWVIIKDGEKDKYLAWHLLLRQADIWELVGQWDRALETHRRLAAYAESGCETEWAARQMVNMGRMMYRMGDHEEAVSLLEKIGTIFIEAGDLKQQANICNILGNIRLNQGRYGEAGEFFRRRLELNTVMDDSAGLCATFGNLGNLEYVQGHLDAAEEWYNKQFRHSEAHEMKELQAVATGALGCIYAQREQFDRARQTFNIFLSLAGEIGDTGKIRVALGNIGNCHIQSGDYAQARETYQSQLVLAQRLGEKKGICLAWGNMAKASHRLGEQLRAQEEVLAAISIGEKMGLKYFLAEQYLLLAEVRFELKLLALAKEAAGRALDLARENGDPDDEKSADELLSEIFKTMEKQRNEGHRDPGVSGREG